MADTMKDIINIDGMHCASCVRTIENSVNKVKGVHEGNVNLASGKATVTYDPAITNRQEIEQAINKTGYKAVKAEDAHHDHQEMMREREIKILRPKIIIGAAVGLLIMWATIPGVMETAPSFLKNPFVQLAIATPIQFWAAWQFAWSCA